MTLVLRRVVPRVDQIDEPSQRAAHAREPRLPFVVIRRERRAQQPAEAARGGVQIGQARLFHLGQRLELLSNRLCLRGMPRRGLLIAPAIKAGQRQRYVTAVILPVVEHALVEQKQVHVRGVQRHGAFGEMLRVGCVAHSVLPFCSSGSYSALSTSARNAAS